MLLQKLQSFIISQVIKMKFLDGYRTYLGGAFFLFTGLGLYLNMAASGVYDQATATKADLMIGAGLTGLGLAGKFDKLTDATKKDK